MGQIASVVLLFALPSYPDGPWSALPDADLIARQGARGDEAALMMELQDRLDQYPELERERLVDQLIATVEEPTTSGSYAPRGPCSGVLARFRGAGTAPREKIQAHMRRFILEGRWGDSSIIGRYLMYLPQMESSDENYAVIHRFLTEERYARVREASSGRAVGLAFVGLAHGGSAAVPKLIGYMSR